MFDQYIFTLEMQVRDYELDYQGIVNNANYLHYLEHTRHEFCRQAGLTFGEMHSMGIDPVLARVNIEYKTPLRIGDNFVSCLRLGRHGAAFIFFHISSRWNPGAACRSHRGMYRKRTLDTRRAPT